MQLRRFAILFWVLAAAVLVVFLVLSVVYLGPIASDFVSPRPLYFRTINIDTQTMSAQLSDPFPGRDPPRAQYYSTWTSYGGYGPHSFRSIYHYDGAMNLPYKVRLNAFNEDHDKRLRSRSKLQELASGRYGTVYADIHFRYWKVKGSDFGVMLYANKAEHEPAQIVDDLPRPTPPLCAISLVRVFRAQPEYAVVTAVYDLHGKQQRASIFLSKGGDWFQDTGTLRQETLAGIKNNGLPDLFPIADYLEGKPCAWQDLGKPNPENIINFHYDYNRWVRQDVFDGAGKRTTRYLTYVVTPEDKMLEAIDRELPFDTYKTQ